MFKGGAICRNVRQKRLNLGGQFRRNQAKYQFLRGGSFAGIGGQFAPE